MPGRLTIMLLFGFFVFGCATNQHKFAVERLQIRIGELERQLEDKNDEVADLEEEVDRLHSELQRREVVRQQEIKAIKKEGILRVAGVDAEQVQKALQKAGYYDRAIDGKIGQNTKKAIIQFQKDHNLKADGVIGQRTWEKLKTYLEE